MKSKFNIILSIIFLALIGIIVFFIIKNNETKTASSNLTTECCCKRLFEIKKRGYLKVGIKVDVPRFGFLNPETNKEEGFEPDLSREISKKIFGGETKIKFKPITPKTRGALLDNNELDFVAATFTITEKRRKSYNFTVPYYTDYISFLANKNTSIKDINDLSGKTIGVPQSTPTRKCLEAESEKIKTGFNFAEYSSYHELKNALYSGRIDVFSADKSILLGYQDENTDLSPICLNKQEYAIACKLENKDFCEYLNEIIKDLKDEGILDNLMKKWDL